LLTHNENRKCLFKFTCDKSFYYCVKWFDLLRQLLRSLGAQTRLSSTSSDKTFCAAAEEEKNTV
jgi:hypothetical protein